jgi:hypothetical protein
MRSWLLLLLCVHVHGRVVAGDTDGDTLSDELEAHLAAKFSPIVFFHPHEQYFPDRVENFIAASSLLYRRADPGPDCMMHPHIADAPELPSLVSYKRDVAAHVGLSSSCTLEPSMPAGTHEFTRRSLRGSPGAAAEASPEPEPERISSCDTLLCGTFEYLTDGRRATECMDRFESSSQGVLSMDGPESRSFYLEPSMQYLEDKVPTYDLDARAPAYVHVFPTVNNAFPGTVSIQYWFFFPFNGNTADMFNAGAHEGDWEHITVVVEPVSELVIALYFAAHSHEAYWLDPTQVTFSNKTHPHVYSALHTHASYESVGRKRRRLPVLRYMYLTDFCEDSGVVWAPHECINLGEATQPYPNTRWTHFNGHWGSRRRSHTHVPLMIDTGFPPRSPPHQADYWYLN